MISRKPEYKIENSEKGEFIIKNYNFSKPFSSFFPGIAGPEGSPIWCFYVNRGQCITSFGTDNKDGSILEFQPANKAYGMTTTYGFRTFIKFKKDKIIIYEPFSEKNLYEQAIKNKMTVTPFSLELKEENNRLGLQIIVNYFTLPGEKLASLIRKVTIKNFSHTKKEFALLDGLPNINPYGIKNDNLKNMSRTSEAWSFIENLENKIPFYHIQTLIEDASKVNFEKKGNFFISFINTPDGPILLDPIVDPFLIFGNSPDFTFPYKFVQDQFEIPAIQHYENRSPSAFAHGQIELSPGESTELISMIGHAPDIESLNTFISTKLNIDYINNKSLENKETIMELMDNFLVSSGSINFDNYTAQTFLDNILRGGFPLSISYKDRHEVLYLYSRKHGDPERDYNDFLLKGNYLSYGNGNFRDIAQNRRNDLWFNTDVEDSNIKYFADLIQLDGHNPLVVQGNLYHFTKNSINLDEIVNPSITEKFKELLECPFEIHELAEFYRIYSSDIKKNIFDFAAVVLTNCDKEEFVSHHEGFWVDHWFYLTDLIESYAAIYPEKLNELIFNKECFSFYDNDYYVVSRNKKYVTDGNTLRQFNSVAYDKHKRKMIESRKTYKNRMRTKNGKGEIYFTTLFNKLFTLVLNKFASLDSRGTGIEMDSDKPGWNDSLNGLPGLFGSSTCETQQLYRMINLLLNFIDKFNSDNIIIRLPFEIYDFHKNLENILQKYNNKKINDHKYWDNSANIKEKYRNQIHNGISGKEKKIHLKKLYEFLKSINLKLEDGIKKSFNKKDGLYNTYYKNMPVKYSGTYVYEFSQEPLPYFLESQMHALLNEKDKTKCKSLYQAVAASDLYDKKLKMYKVNISLDKCTHEIGRARSFTPGWLENESIFLHMHYKYLLSLLRCGLHEEFTEEIKQGLIPFLDPETYGRSIFENSSFIASSSNPDSSIHGTGFIARLSGSTAEFIHILLHMAFGPFPFKLENEKLIFSPEPVLPGWLFNKKNKKIRWHHHGDVKEFTVPENSFAILFLGKTLVVYKNKNLKNTFGEGSASIKKIILYDSNKKNIEFHGNKIGPGHSFKIREGKFSQIDIELG